MIDQFLMQLLIVPFVVIGLGVIISTKAKKVYLAPLITLILNLIYEVWYLKYYYPESEVTFTSWNIILPVISLGISLMVSSMKKE